MEQILYITGQSVTFFQAHRRSIHKVGQFSCTDAGYAELCAALGGADARPVSILVDLIEEEFREDMLPHTLGRDRALLHARHAGKLFRATPFRYHRVVDRQRQGRRDDIVLFSALTNRDNIEPLLAILETAGVAVRGICSLPLVTRRLIRPLGAQTGNVLIVTEQPDGGLRETFVRDGQVHFSRLAPVSDLSPADYPDVLASEARKTRRYLNTLRLLPHDQPLEVYALCDSQRIAALQGLADIGENINVRGVPLVQLADKLGLVGHPDTALSDALFCYLLSRHNGRNHYAKGSQLRNWRTWQLRAGLHAATWLIAVGAVTLAGMRLIDGRLLVRETAQMSDVIRQVEADYGNITRSLPIQPGEALAMREAAALADRLRTRSEPVEALFSMLGDSFSAHPGLVMDELDWFLAEHSDATQPALADPTGDVRTLAATPYLISGIAGHINNFDGNYSNAQRQLVSVTEGLAARPGVVDATVVRKPLNTQTDNTLQGGISSSGEQEAAEFEIRLVLELGNDPV